MEKISTEELNAAAMQIIMHAGDSRNFVNEALRCIETDGDVESAKAKMKDAKKEIVQAHRIQTDTIQATIEDEELQTTLLFSHAQDTLMTIYSELNITNHLISIYERIMLDIKNKN